MQKMIISLLNNELFLLLMNGVLAHTAFTVVMLSVLQLPPETLLDSGLQEVLLVFAESIDSD